MTTGVSGVAPAPGPVEAALIRVYGLVLPVTSAFSFSQIVTPPLVVSLVLLLWLLRRDMIRLTADVAFIAALFVGPAILSATFNIGFSGNERFLNHLASYAAVVVLFYLVPYSFMAQAGGRELFVKWINVGLAVSCLFLVFEFVAMNFLDIDVQALIPRSAVQEYGSTVLPDVARPRSFVEESGHFALYVALLGPTCLLLEQRGLKVALGVLYVTAILLTFSTTGYVSLACLGAIVLFTVTWRWRLILVAALVALVLLLHTAFAELVQLAAVVVLDKFTSSSFIDRGVRIYDSLLIWQQASVAELLFGLGPGYHSYYQVEPVVALYALALFQTGLVGALCLTLLAVKYLVKWSALGDRTQRLVFGIALVSMLLFYAGVSNYWYPWLWALLAIIDRAPVAVMRLVQSSGPRYAGSARH